MAEPYSIRLALAENDLSVLQELRGVSLPAFVDQKVHEYFKAKETMVAEATRQA